MNDRVEPVVVLGGVHSLGALDAPLSAQAWPGEGGPAATDIVYTCTRVAPVSQEVLMRNRVVTALEPGDASDSYKILAIQVIQWLRERQANSLAVISAGSGEGRTLTAANLAISLAGEVDHSVLLVDANLRSPGVHALFGLEPGPGLSDHLLSNRPLEEILINPGLPRLVLLPGGRPIINSVEMLGSHKTRRLVEELKTRYASRLILFDLPPVLSAADVLAFAPLVDAAILVVEESRTSRDDILRTLQLLSSVEVIGTVLNKSVQTPTARKA